VSQPGVSVVVLHPAMPASCTSEPFGWRAKLVTDPELAEAT
jgi:hypothetical protein